VLLLAGPDTVRPPAATPGPALNALRVLVGVLYSRLPRFVNLIFRSVFGRSGSRRNRKNMRVTREGARMFVLRAIDYGLRSRQDWKSDVFELLR
jgi:hypothetical protein